MFRKAPFLLERRNFLNRAGRLSLALLVTPLWAAGKNPVLLAVRVWPAEDYTRVTLELDAPVRFSHFALENPERLVVDIEGVELNKTLEGLADKVGASDPYIRLLRAGRFKPGVLRLVMELKTRVAPQVFTLPPVGAYGHRLVLDIYPRTPIDPLMALLNQKEEPDAAFSEEPRENASPAAENTDGSADKKAVKPEPAKTNVPEKTESKRARLYTITLDPGHGGEDPGAIGRGGHREKNIALSVAKRLKTRLEEQQARVALTRDGDFFVPLATRVQKARKVHSDLFVSIHADAWIKPEAHGSSVFVLSEQGASSSAARWLAQKENKADLIGGVNLNIKDPVLARTLLDLSQTATKTDSIRLARLVLGELGGINRLHRNQVEQAGFAVLKAPDIPSVLVETAFISNPEEERKLSDENYQNKLADAMARGILRYLEQNPPPPRA